MAPLKKEGAEILRGRTTYETKQNSSYRNHLQRL